MDPWLPWLYHYGIGSLFFVGTLLWLWRAGAVRPDRPADRWGILALGGGLVLFALGHMSWIAWVAGR